MSTSSCTRLPTECKSIPKRVLISDPSDITCSYSSTPGGTLFSTTPGGTRIVYEKAFLMNLRNSPISKTPPKWEIPESLVKGASPKTKKSPKKTNNRQRHQHNNNNKHMNGTDDTEQFQMDM